MRNYLNFRKEALNYIFGQLANALVQGKPIEIRGFGSFDCRHRPTRISGNPKTGVAVYLPAKAAVHFKPRKGNKSPRGCRACPTRHHIMRA